MMNVNNARQHVLRLVMFLCEVGSFYNELIDRKLFHGFISIL